MEFIQGLFSSEPSLGRLNPIGILLMVIGAFIAMFLAPRVERSGDENRTKALPLYAVGLVIACAGAMISMIR